MSVYPTPSTRGGPNRSKDKVEGPEAEAISRLEAAAEEALAKYPKASQWYQVVGALVDVARYDLDMLWVLTKSSVKFGAQDFLSKYKAKRAPLGHDEAEARLLVAERGRAANGSPSRSSDGRGQDRVDAQTSSAPPAGVPRPGRLSAAAIEVRVGLADGILRREMVNGKPLGDCTPEELRDAAKSHRVKGLFYLRIAQGCPEGRPVKGYLRNDEVEEMLAWAKKRAEQEPQ